MGMKLHEESVMGLNIWGAQCSCCGKRNAIIFDKDPYMEELYPENENDERWWCEECYQESLWEI